MKDFEAAIRAWRKEKNYTIQQAAATLDVPMRTLQEWLAGREPRIERQQVILEKMKK